MEKFFVLIQQHRDFVTSDPADSYVNDKKRFLAAYRNKFSLNVSDRERNYRWNEVLLSSHRTNLDVRFYFPDDFCSGHFHQLPLSVLNVGNSLSIQFCQLSYQVSLLFGLYPKFFRCKNKFISRKFGRSTSLRCQHSSIRSYISLGQFFGNGKIIWNIWFQVGSLSRQCVYR